ncbi:MAG: glycosyltransferase family 2 protein [Bryobacteraceae bacterium]
MMAEILFWVCAGIIFYVYVGYYLLVTLIALISPRPVRKAPIEPSVSILVAAFNEAHVIEAKIRNALALDYPADRLEIVIASDGSTDGTSELAARFTGDPRVRVLNYPVNRGKLAVLNDTVPRLHGEIVVFSDAAAMLDPSALRSLIANFADPEVGAVSGLYGVVNHDSVQIGAQEDFYWKYETFLKQQEAAIGSILGAHGALYAVRKELYPFPALGTINDDFVIPIRIVGRGYRVAYEPSAVALEEAHEMGGFSRRARIMAGNFEQLRELKELLRPPRWLVLFTFLSHKGGRLVVPLCMVGMAAANLALLGKMFYAWLGAFHGAFYVAAVLGGFVKLRPKLLRLPYYFCMLNAAVFAGIYYATLGRRHMAWKRK